MNDTLREIIRWADRGDQIVVATLVGAVRSAPRPLGTKIAINDRGEVSGNVSGGCVEGAVVAIAEQVMQSGHPELAHFGIDDDAAWGVGLPCGGEIDVWVEPYLRGGAFENAALLGGRAAEVTVLAGPEVGAKLVVTPEGPLLGTLGSATADAEAAETARELLWADVSARRGNVFIDVVGPAPRLFLVGAVDITAAICTLARGIGWRSFVIDPRGSFATRDRFPDADEVLPVWPVEAFDRLGGIDRGTSLIALTHDPKLDDAALIVGLRSAAVFVGAMGSRRAQSKRRGRLLEAGLTNEELDRLSAPVGLDLGASSSQETALSILAEVVAVTHGHHGGRLVTRAGRIHAEARGVPAQTVSS